MISGLRYAKIYRQFIWKWRDCQRFHWHALFVCVVSCEKGWHFSPFDQVWFVKRKFNFFWFFHANSFNYFPFSFSFFMLLLFFIFCWPIPLQLGYKTLEHFILLLLLLLFSISIFILSKSYVDSCFIHISIHSFWMFLISFNWMSFFNLLNLYFLTFLVFMTTFKHWFELLVNWPNRGKINEWLKPTLFHQLASKTLEMQYIIKLNLLETKVHCYKNDKFLALYLELL